MNGFSIAEPVGGGRSYFMRKTFSFIEQTPTPFLYHKLNENLRNFQKARLNPVFLLSGNNNDINNEIINNKTNYNYETIKYHDPACPIHEYG